MRVLIVDDEKNNRLLLEEMLESCGIFEMTMAEDGKSAYDLMASEGFELVFMDYHLPLMNGREVIDQLYASQLGIKTSVVMVTGSAYHDKEEMVHPMIKGWVRKPLSTDRIKKVLKQIKEMDG